MSGLSSVNQAVLGTGASAAAGASSYAILGQDPLEGAAVGATGALLAFGGNRLLATRNETQTSTTSLRDRVREATGYRPPSGGGGPTDIIQTEEGPIFFGHGGRHLESEALTVNKVHDAIARDVQTRGFPAPGELATHQIKVEGVTVEYNIYGLEGGANVGTYHEVR